MTTDTRFERQLPAILEDLYLGPTPDYRNDALAAAVRTRQRPAWTFPGRWFPMLEVSVRPVAAPRLPVRALITALLILALLLAAVVYVGSRLRLPAPYGPARNGLITWAFDGDIFVGDPETGSTQRVVAGDDIDRNPVFSKDGTHLAFMRQVPTETGRFDLVVTGPDGSRPVTLTSTSVLMPNAVEWAPDGESLLVNESDGRLTRFFLDRSPAKLLLEGVHLEPDAFRPPDGGQILYERPDDQGAVYITNIDGTGARQVFGPRVAPCACGLSGPARWSPDGKMVALSANADGLQSRLYVVDADHGGIRQLAKQTGTWTEDDPAWSPDGARIAFNRWQYVEGPGWSVKAVAVADVTDGTVSSIGVAPPEEGAVIEWAPDGRSILSLPGTVVEAFTWSPNANGTVARPTVLDLTDGSSRQIDWSVSSVASWQRLP